MIVFSEKVQPTFTSSDHNVIIVEDFNEIFFDVFELEINGNKFVAEKVSDHNGSPVVTIPIENDGKKYNVPCILEKGDKFELYYNKDAQKTYKPVKTSPKTNDTNILELVETKIQEKVPLFEVPDIEKAVDTIKSIKESAASYLERMRLEYLDEQKREIDKYEKKKKSEIKRLNDDYRRNMVSEFYAITETIKDQISEQNNKERDQYNDFINESFNQYCQELDQKVGKDYQSAIKLFESKIETLTNDIFAEKIQNIFESKVNDLEIVLSSKESLFEKEFSSKFSGKFDEYSKKILENVENKSNSFKDHVESLVERYENAIQALQESNIETNDLITKNTNRALSRIGNVKTVLTNKIDEDLSKLQESTKEAEKELRAKISNHKSYIKKYFGDKVSILETKITDISEEYRADVIDLIRKSEEKLLNEISKIDRELPTVILKEARGKNRDNTEVSLEDIRRELEGNISNKFSKEIVSLKRLIEMTSGGGSGGGGGGSITTEGINNLDGGRSDSVYTITQTIDGGSST